MGSCSFVFQLSVSMSMLFDVKTACCCLQLVVVVYRLIQRGLFTIS